MASFLNQARNLAYDYSGARNIMTGARQLGKASTVAEGFKGVGNIALGTVGFIPGIGAGSKLAGGVIQKGAKVFGKKAPPLVTNVSKKLTTKQPIKGLTASPIKSSMNVVRKPNAKFTGVRNIAREGARGIVSTRGLAATGVNISSSMADKTRPQQSSTTGTIENQVTKPKPPILTVVQPNNPTLNPKPSTFPPKTDNTRISTLPGNNGSVTLDNSLLKPFEITPKQPSTQTPTKTPTTTGTKTPSTTPSTTTGTPTTSTNTTQTTTPTTSNLMSNNFTGVFNQQTGKTEYVDLEQQRRDEAAKIALDKYNQATYNDELQRNSALEYQNKRRQELSDFEQLGALQQQKTQLENKTYGIPPYLEAASKRYQGGLARSQALGAIREQDIRDALSQRQMSARGRSAGIVGGLAPALLGSGLTGAGRSYKLDTRNEVLRRAEEQAALKESYDVYLAEAARQSQLEQLEDAKTRSLLVDQIRSLGSN